MTTHDQDARPSAVPLPTSKKPDAPPSLNMSWKPLASPSVWELATRRGLALLRLAALNQTATVRADEVTVSVESTYC